MVGDLGAMSAPELLRRYRRKEVSPVEVTRATLDRIDVLDQNLNAFCFRDDTAALRMARESERRWLAGKPCGLVDGIPVTIKDLILVKGWPTLRGSLTIPTEQPWEEDAPCVARLREHGAVLVGKTTSPEFGWKGVTDSPLTGVTRNPWNPDMTPAGSSGGAAAAAAAGMGVLHIGTDGGGSIRMPAAFCGVYGLKPTFGRVAAYPQSPLPMISHIGPITRTVTDAALMLTVIGVPDPRDWLALPLSGQDYRVGLEGGVAGLRIAYSRDLGYAAVDPKVAVLADRAVETFSDLGAHVELADPGFESPHELFRVHYYGHYSAIGEGMTAKEREVLDPGLRDLMESGKRYSTRDWLLAAVGREELARRMSLFMTDYDLLITPQMPLTAFEVGANVPRGRGMKEWMEWTPFTFPFNLTQQPAASVPCGLTSEGLPVAIQIVGRKYEEHLVLQASRAYEAVHPFPLPKTPGP